MLCSSEASWLWEPWLIIFHSGGDFGFLVLQLSSPQHSKINKVLMIAIQWLWGERSRSLHIFTEEYNEHVSFKENNAYAFLFSVLETTLATCFLNRTVTYWDMKLSSYRKSLRTLHVVITKLSPSYFWSVLTAGTFSKISRSAVIIRPTERDKN